MRRDKGRGPLYPQRGDGRCREMILVTIVSDTRDQILTDIRIGNTYEGANDL